MLHIAAASLSFLFDAPLDLIIVVNFRGEYYSTWALEDPTLLGNAYSGEDIVSCGDDWSYIAMVQFIDDFFGVAFQLVFHHNDPEERECVLRLHLLTIQVDHLVQIVG